MCTEALDAVPIRGIVIQPSRVGQATQENTMTKQQGLASALLAAQQALPSVGKDSQFKSQSYGYAYTSSETMIAACREVLHAAGLTLRRAGWKFDGTPEGGGLVTSQMILTHAGTGESVSDEVAWVAVPRGQQPIDKAVAGALTASLGYYLRDLLLVPREDENEMDKRDDSSYQPRKAAPAPARSNPSTLAASGSGNAPARPAQQDAPQSVTAPKAAPTPPKAKEPATEVPGAFGEVLASRPPKDCAWRSGLTIRRVGQGKPTAKGSNRYPILLDVGGSEQWASCFDDRVMQAAQDALGGQAVSGFVQEGQYGWTLYGIRTTLESTEQQAAPVAVEDDDIPF
jgi:hypothetical protein